MDDSGTQPGAGDPQELTLTSTVSLGCGTRVTLLELLEAASASESISRELDKMRYGRLSSGDIVELRSGGPPMTVSRIHSAKELVECFWFDLEGRLRKRAFPRIAVWKLGRETGQPERLDEVEDTASHDEGGWRPASNNERPDDEILPF